MNPVSDIEQVKRMVEEHLPEATLVEDYRGDSQDLRKRNLASWKSLSAKAKKNMRVPIREVVLDHEEGVIRQQLIAEIIRREKNSKRQRTQKKEQDNAK